MPKGLKNILKRVLPPSTAMVDARISETTEEVREMIGGLSVELSSCKRDLSALYADLFSDQIVVDRDWLDAFAQANEHPLVVSVASYGPRAPLMAPMVHSLGRQTLRPDLICFWLPTKDFPRGLADLPVEVLHELKAVDAKVCWVENDLGAHNKYFYIMQAIPRADVVTLDDDCEYQSELLAELKATSERFPGCVVASRANLMAFQGKEGLAPYCAWEFGQRRFIDEPRSDLLPTGLGGVFYPAGILPPRTFDSDKIKETCLRADDLWLKAMEAIADVRTVATRFEFAPRYIDGSQEAGLFVQNVDGGENDRQFSAILNSLRREMPACDIVGWFMSDSDKSNNPKGDWRSNEAE